MTAPTCCLCGRPIHVKYRWEEESGLWGHNSYPLAVNGRCCGVCVGELVIPARFRGLADRDRMERERN